MNRDDFDTGEIYDNVEQCPKCGSRSTYNKSDYFFKD